MAAITGASVTRLQRFRPQAWIGWFLFIIGMGVFTRLHADTPKAFAIGVNGWMAISTGILYCEHNTPFQFPPVGDDDVVY